LRGYGRSRKGKKKKGRPFFEIKRGDNSRLSHNAVTKKTGGGKSMNVFTKRQGQEKGLKKNTEVGWSKIGD